MRSLLSWGKELEKWIEVCWLGKQPKRLLELWYAVEDSLLDQLSELLRLGGRAGLHLVVQDVRARLVNLDKLLSVKELSQGDKAFLKWQK